MARKPALTVLASAKTGPVARVFPLIELGESFLRHCDAENFSPHTIESYRESIKQLAHFLADQHRSPDPAHVRREDVEAFISYLLRKFKPTTAAVRFRSLQSFFRWLAEEKEIPTSPMANLKPPKLPEAPPPVLREADLLRVFKKLERSPDGFETRRDHALLSLLLRTGARRAEITGLRYAPDYGEINDILPGLTMIRVRGKGNRIRYVPLDPKAVKSLDRYLRVRSRHPHADSPWLWLSPRGRLTENGAYQVVQRRGQAAGVNLHPHSFRHTYSDEYLSKGGNETDLMELAGWRSRAMVLRYAAATRHDRAVENRRRLSLFENL